MDCVGIYDYSVLGSEYFTESLGGECGPRRSLSNLAARPSVLDSDPCGAFSQSADEFSSSKSVTVNFCIQVRWDYHYWYTDTLLRTLVLKGLDFSLGTKS
jgi:hypothetical protein